MSGKHTPGPWTAVVAGSVFGDDGSRICRIFFGSKAARRSEEFANASLIEQAPEMARLIRERLRQVEAGEVQRTALDDNFAAVLDKAGVTE